MYDLSLYTSFMYTSSMYTLSMIISGEDNSFHFQQLLGKPYIKRAAPKELKVPNP